MVVHSPPSSYYSSLFFFFLRTDRFLLSFYPLLPYECQHGIYHLVVYVERVRDGYVWTDTYQCMGVLVLLWKGKCWSRFYLSSPMSAYFLCFLCPPFFFAYWSDNDYCGLPVSCYSTIVILIRLFVGGVVMSQSSEEERPPTSLYTLKYVPKAYNDLHIRVLLLSLLLFLSNHILL